jgi:signal transduction histidine kinase
MSIRLRLTLWYTALLAAILLAFGSGLYVFLSVKLMDDVKRSLVREAEYVLSKIVYIELLQLVQLPTMKEFKSVNFFMQTYTFRNGRLDSNFPMRLEISEAALEHARNRETHFETIVAYNQSGEAEKLLVYTAPLSVKQQVIGVLQVVTPLASVTSTLNTLKLSLALLGFVGLLLSLTTGWFMARKSLTPIDNVIAAAQSVQSGADLSKRIAYDGPRDELGRLTETINGMLARLQQAYSDLEKAYSQQRQFVSDASHELRTPLTTIRGNAGLLAKMWRERAERAEGSEHPALAGAGGPDAEHMKISLEALEDITDEAERMSRLVNDLLELARADAGQELQKEKVEVRPLIEEVSRRAQFLPRTAEWRTGDFRAVDGVSVCGNRDYLQQLLFIFIENAFKFTPEGLVELEVRREQGQVGFVIRDTGVGMTGEEVPQIFNRFYRADISRGKTKGTGLGLSIAKWIIDQHGGSIEVETAPGEGTTFTIWIPEWNEERDGDRDTDCDADRDAARDAEWNGARDAGRIADQSEHPGAEPNVGRDGERNENGQRPEEGTEKGNPAGS